MRGEEVIVDKGIEEEEEKGGILDLTPDLDRDLEAEIE